MFNTSDFTKMFDPSQYAKNMQKMWDLSQAATASSQNMEAMKQVGTIITNTVGNCTEKQFKFAQAAMEDCIECLRELSTAKGMEDYVQKQAELSKRSAEKCQSLAQEITSQWQKSQSQCTDIISKQMSQTAEWGKTFATNATNAATSAAKSATNTATATK